LTVVFSPNVCEWRVRYGQLVICFARLARISIVVARVRIGHTGLTAAASYLGGTLTLDKGMGANHTVFEGSIATPAAASQPAWRVQVVDERLQVRSAQP